MAAKKDSRRKRFLRLRKARESEVNPASRNHLLDAIRGFAIVLMIIDHLAGILFHINITPNSIRFLTRLAMPLFAILMGYFLASSSRVHTTRLLQIFAATVAINILFYPYYGQVDILAALLVCYLLWCVLGNAFTIFCFSSLLFPWDRSGLWFDYSLTIVATMIAQGMVLRKYGLRAAIGTGVIITLSVWHVPPTISYVLYFTLPATLMIGIAEKRGEIQVPLLDALGRYPLTAYVFQYYLIFAAAKLLSQQV